MRYKLIPFAITACVTAGSAFAQSPILGLESIEVIRGWRQADGTHMAAVHIRMEKNWKTYWRVAGGGGIPPQFDWSSSKNIRSATIKWPAPKIYTDYGLRTIGYKDELILPIEFHPVDPQQPMRVDGTIDFGICEDVCVPVRSALQADLPPRASVGKAVINTALKSQAKSGKAKGVKVTGCDFKPIQGGFQISATLKSNAGFNKQAIGVIEYPASTDSWMNQEASKTSGQSLVIQASLYSKDTSFIDRSKVRMTILMNNQAVEITGCGS
jgi:DsbC/DsbD-like thiol-disulfide interchange protein